MPEYDDSTPRPRRSKPKPQQPEPPQGYRSSKRTSAARKGGKKHAPTAQAQAPTPAPGASEASSTARRVLVVAGSMLGGLALVALLLWGGAWGINSIVRWKARQTAEEAQAAKHAAQLKENLVLIARDAAGKPAGFIALRYDQASKSVYGLAIPDAAFIEVPGQGFESLGDAMANGPETAVAAIANYLGVPFERWAYISRDDYQAALKGQSMTTVLASVPPSEGTNLTPDELAGLKAGFASVASKDVALVPLPVKPVRVGTETYFEPSRQEIADLLKTWWGVDINAKGGVMRVIVYNGAGEPGIAGEAAQELIKSGYRVVDTKNADRFDYQKTKIVVQKGDKALGEKVQQILGTGDVVVQPADQDVAEIVVIVGQDFKPAK